MHKTVFFHLPPRAVSGILKRRRHTQTCNCIDRVTVKHEADICDLFSLYANQIHKSCQAAALEVMLDHQSYTLLASGTEIIAGNGILSVSMGFGSLFGKMSQCASDKSTAIITFCTICRSAPRLSCSAVRT